VDNDVPARVAFRATVDRSLASRGSTPIWLADGLAADGS
jgi:hypothetical protein